MCVGGGGSDHLENHPLGGRLGALGLRRAVRHEQPHQVGRPHDGHPTVLGLIPQRHPAVRGGGSGGGARAAGREEHLGGATGGHGDGGLARRFRGLLSALLRRRRLPVRDDQLHVRAVEEAARGSAGARQQVAQAAQLGGLDAAGGRGVEEDTFAAQPFRALACQARRKTRVWLADKRYRRRRLWRRRCRQLVAGIGEHGCGG